MSEKLRQWLDKELTERGWSHRELARRAGLSQTAISSVLSETEKRGPGWDFCAAIARPLGKTPEEVLRLAGLLSPIPESVQEEEEILGIIRQLPKIYRLFLLQMLRGVQEQPGQARPESKNGEVHILDVIDLVLKLTEVPPDHIRQTIIYLENKRDSMTGQG